MLNKFLETSIFPPNCLVKRFTYKIFDLLIKRFTCQLVYNKKLI